MCLDDKIEFHIENVSYKNLCVFIFSHIMIISNFPRPAFLPSIHKTFSCIFFSEFLLALTLFVDVFDRKFFLHFLLRILREGPFFSFCSSASLRFSFYFFIVSFCTIILRPCFYIYSYTLFTLEMENKFFRLLKLVLLNF